MHIVSNMKYKSAYEYECKERNCCESVIGSAVYLLIEKWKKACANTQIVSVHLITAEPLFNSHLHLEF